MGTLYDGANPTPWWAVLIAGILVGIAAEYIVVRGDVDGAPWWLDLAVGWTYMGAGLIAWARRPANPMGRLMAATGFAWFIGNFGASGVPLLVSLAVGFEALPLGMMLHVVLAYPWGKLQKRLERILFAVGYTILGIRGIVAVLFIDRPLDCSDCPKGVVPWASPAAEGLFQYSTLAFGPISVVIFTLLVRRYLRATPVRRRALTELWIAGTILLVLSTIEVVTFSLGWQPLSAAFFHAMNVAQLAIPLSLLVGLFRL